MTRHFWVLTHRYAGLAMTLFLVIVGLTGIPYSATLHTGYGYYTANGHTLPNLQLPLYPSPRRKPGSSAAFEVPPGCRLSPA